MYQNLLFQTSPRGTTPGTDLLSRDLAVRVPSAWMGLTAVFGMGTGVAPSREAPGILPPKLFFNSPIGKSSVFTLDTKMRLSLTADSYGLAPWITPRPHPTDQSNSLLEAFRFHKGTGTSHLEVGFTLRCFQRLSRPRSSYPAMARVGQPVRQRRVHLGPLVLKTTHSQKSCAYGR